MRNIIGYILIILLAIAITFNAITLRKPKITCDSFDNWYEAQETYEENPKKYGYLDGDNNKVACQKLKDDL